MSPLHHVAFRTTDTEALVAFYERVVGLPRASVSGNGVWLLAGDVVLMVEARAADEGGPDETARDLLAFRPASLSRAEFEPHLARHGVAVEDVTEHSVYFRDPDGRRLAFSDFDFGAISPEPISPSTPRGS